MRGSVREAPSWGVGGSGSGGFPGVGGGGWWGFPGRWWEVHKLKQIEKLEKSKNRNLTLEIYF